MRPVVIGGLVAAAIIAAFVIGLLIAEEDKGPLERAGGADLPAVERFRAGQLDALALADDRDARVSPVGIAFQDDVLAVNSRREVDLRPLTRRG